MTRTPDPTTNTYGVCDGCGGSLMWGGMSWVPHTDAYHQVRRRMMMIAVRHALLAKLGSKLGHRVVLEFTADVAWTDCAGCDWLGSWVPHSGIARGIGQRHQALAGLAWLEGER